MNIISKEQFLFFVRVGLSYVGSVENVGLVSYKKNWHPYFIQQNKFYSDHISSQQGYTLEITPAQTSNTSENIKSEVENEFYNNVHHLNESNDYMFDSAWSWIKEHFDFRAEYEVSLGTQLAAGIKKAGYAEINAHSYVMQNITYSSKNGLEDPIYRKYMDTEQPQVTTQSLGAAYYVGAEFSSRKVKNGNTMYTISVGGFCIGGEVSWD